MEEEVKVISFKKKKTSYNPYKVSAIVVIGVLVLVFIMNLYASKNRDYLWLKCNYNTERTDYKETISFKFLKKQDGVLYEYYRDENSHKRNTVGTGLGLSIVKNVFELHKLEYGVTSNEEDGTVFYFKIKTKEM